MENLFSDSLLEEEMRKDRILAPEDGKCPRCNADGAASGDKISDTRPSSSPSLLKLRKKIWLGKKSKTVFRSLGQ